VVVVDAALWIGDTSLLSLVRVFSCHRSIKSDFKFVVSVVSRVMSCAITTTTVLQYYLHPCLSCCCVLARLRLLREGASIQIRSSRPLDNH
jgi:hypothetical protein